MLTSTVMIHICTQLYIYSTYIPTKNRARKSFVTRPFLFNTQETIVFMRESFILYNKGVFTDVRCLVTFLITNSDTYSSIRLQIGTYMYLQSWRVVPQYEYQGANRLRPRLWGQYQGKPCGNFKLKCTSGKPGVPTRIS